MRISAVAWKETIDHDWLISYNIQKRLPTDCRLGLKLYKARSAISRMSMSAANRMLFVA